LLKQDYDTSIYFHEKHLNLARQLNDSVGQCRAYLILSQLYQKIGQNEKANKYESLHRALAREIGETPIRSIDDEEWHRYLMRSNDQIPLQNMAIDKRLRLEASTMQTPANTPVKNLRADSINIVMSDTPSDTKSDDQRPLIQNNNNHHQSDLKSFAGTHLSDEKKSQKQKNSNSLRTAFFPKKLPIPYRKESLPAGHDELVELVCRMQKTRFEDQRCHFKTNEPEPNTRGHRPSAQLEDILNTVDRLQQLRLNDQRTTMPSNYRNDIEEEAEEQHEQ
ncbi:unnamed protein product, partial [Didymodactylos carnosus]